MKHGVIEVFAYQETLLIMAVFGIAILTLIWVGFRRWLQQKERIGRLIAEQTTAQHGAHMERLEERLKAVEHIVTGEVETAAPIDAAPGEVIPTQAGVQPHQ